jgi:xanthine permease XanP
MALSKSSSNLQYAVDENPSHLMALALGVQHVLFMFSGVLLMAVLLSNAGLISQPETAYLAFVSILVCSVTTLLQVSPIGRIGSGYVLFMGTSGAFIGCTLEAVEQGGLALAAMLAMLSAPLEILMSYFFRHLRKVFTPAVGGVVIMLVAVTLIPITIDLWVGEPGTPGAGSSTNLMIGSVTLTIIGCSFFGQRRLREWAPVTGLAAGYLAAAVTGNLEMTNLQAAGWFGMPSTGWPGIPLEFKAEYWPIFIAFGIATISGTIESVGDAIAVQRVSRRDFRKVDYTAVQGALYSDGLGNFLSGLAGTTPNTTYSGNIALIELNGVASRRVGLYGAGFLGLLAFFPKVAALILDVPGPALGAATFILIGMLFVTGIKVATMEGVSSETALIVSVAFWGGFAAQNGLFFPGLIPDAIKPLVGNGIATGSTIALLLALLFQLKPRSRVRERIPASVANLPALRRFVDNLQGRFRLRSEEMYNLHLCCEEVYVHLCEAEAPGEPDRDILFQASIENDVVLMEITDHSVAEDVDLPSPPPDLERASEEELQNLGLFLVSKLTQDVDHVRISGYNYVSFRINVPR